MEKGLNEMRAVYQRIWELKNKGLTENTKTEIQKLQQTLNSAETLNKNNSANSLTLKAKNSSISKDIEEYLYKREIRNYEG